MQHKEKHDEKNARLPYKQRGWTGFRVRERQTKTGLSVSIEWYYLVYMNSKPYSKNIKKGVKGGALLNNVKRVARRWEYDLILDIYEDLHPIELALNDVSSMLRIYRHTSKLLNEITYSCLDDMVDDPDYDREIDWDNDPIPDWYQGG